MKEGLRDGGTTSYLPSPSGIQTVLGQYFSNFEAYVDDSVKVWIDSFRVDGSQDLVLLVQRPHTHRHKAVMQVWSTVKQAQQEVSWKWRTNMMEDPVSLSTELPQQPYCAKRSPCLVVIPCAASLGQSRRAAAPPPSHCLPEHRSGPGLWAQFRDKSAPKGTSNAIRSSPIWSFLETWLFSYHPCLVLNYK